MLCSGEEGFAPLFSDGSDAILVLLSTGLNVTTDIPEPKVSVSRVVQNRLAGSGLYETVFYLTIDSKVPVTNLFIRVDAASIVSMEAGPRRTGGFIAGHSGKREGWAFTNLPSANGQYDVKDKVSDGY